jgi:hypothetical protein
MNKEETEFWKLRDEYIKRRRSRESVDIDDYCDRPYLTHEEQKELHDQLNEYEAAKEGLEKYAQYRRELETVKNSIIQQLPSRTINLADASSWTQIMTQNIKDWINRAYEHSVEQASKLAEKLIPNNEGVILTAATEDTLPVEIINEKGNTIETVEFQLETPVELDPDGEMVFSAIAPDDTFVGRQVTIGIGHEKRNLILHTSKVDKNRRIEVFLDLSIFGRMHINKDMIKIQVCCQ